MRNFLFVGFLLVLAVAAGFYVGQSAKKKGLSIHAASAVTGVNFEPDETELIDQGVHRPLQKTLRKQGFFKVVDPMPLEFRPSHYKAALRNCRTQQQMPILTHPPMPKSKKWELYTIEQLAQALDAKLVTSVELHTYFIKRLRKLGESLDITTQLYSLSDDALASDKRRQEGKTLGPLDGIPFGVKDVFATKEFKTKWGSPIYAEQQFDEDATVITRLKAEGAVLIAKLSTGELAMGDVWFQNGVQKRTRNPWSASQGSGGSSAGPAAAVSAGLVPFAIGTETWGSLISPSLTTGVVALRPTLDRVSRYGVMPLSWSMDKVGPVCRFMADCALVLSKIQGEDPKDPRAEDCPLSIAKGKTRVGIVRSFFDKVLQEDKAKGKVYRRIIEQLSVLENVEIKEITWPFESYEIGPGLLNLKAESTAVFQDLPLYNLDEKLGRQAEKPGDFSYRPYFLSGTLIPAFDNQNVYRLRERLSSKLSNYFKDQEVDVYITPDRSDEGYSHSLLTNLTGHPVATFPVGFIPAKKLPAGEKPTDVPVGLVVVAPYFKEGSLINFVQKIQATSDIPRRLPQGVR